MKPKTKHSIAPDLSKLYDVIIPSLGHDTKTATGDIVDNSIDAGATKVTVRISEDEIDGEKRISEYLFTDNGKSMDMDGLVESNRFATDTPHEPGDAGLFGAGGSIACYTLADRKVTCVREEQDGEVLISEMDVRWFADPPEDFDLEAPLDIRYATPGEEEAFEGLVGHPHGTMISLSDLKPSAEYKRAYSLAPVLADYFGTTYYAKLGPNLQIDICYGEKKLTAIPADPLYWHRPEALLSKRDESFDFKGKNKEGEEVTSTVRIRMSHLNLNMLGRIGSVASQGLIYSRNDRVIATAKKHKDLWTSNPHYNAARIMVDFNETLDEAFGVTVTKNNVHLSEDLIKEIGEITKGFLSHVADHSRSNSTITEETSALMKEDDVFAQRLKEHGASLGLPVVASKTGAQTRSKKTGKNPGTVTPKNSGRKQSGNTKRFISPRFEYVSEPRTKLHVYYGVDEEGLMVVYINQASDFVNDIYTRGTAATKTAMRCLWAAECLAKFDYYDSEEESTVGRYTEKCGEKLTDIYKVIK